MLTRRSVLLLVAMGGLLGRVHAARAQPARRPHRVGVLRPGAPPPSPADLQITGLPAAMHALGYLEGQSVVYVSRWAGGDLERLPALAGELLDEQVDVVFAVGAPAVRAVKAVTSTVPVVMFGNFDPVAMGLIDSLARPGGNVTGVLIAPDGTLAGKRLELLREAVPHATRIALLVPEFGGSMSLQIDETRAAAQTLGVVLPVVTVRGGDYAAAFAEIARTRAAALVVGSHQYFVRDRRRLVELAAAYRLPAMYEWREQVLDGGLMTYSTSLPGLYRRLADYIDRILKGARPDEMPVERPTQFDLVINLKTARALDLVIPQSLLLRAHELIE